jgi:hypothetical protein
MDIPIDANLNQLLDLPQCSDIQIPFPKPLKVSLPTGGTISAFADISKGIPTDCAMTFSLMLQIAPILASMECLIKVLKLLKPLIDVVQGLPLPSPKVIEDFVKAAADLVPCLLVPTPASIIPFVRDLLCLIIRALKCFLGQMKTILAVMGGLSLQLASAQALGNTALVNSIQCAQQNAQAQAAHLSNSIEPLGVLLDLAGTFMGIAGVKPIKLPSLGSQADLQALQSFVTAIQDVVAVMQVATDALGGCS